MDAKTRSTATAVATSEGSSYTRMIQNFVLLWLDGSIEMDNNDCRNTITQLRQVVNSVSTFTHANECIDFINGITEEKIFLISSGVLGEKTVSIVHDKPQISTIYIFCGNKTRHEKWAQQWPKVNGVYTDITPICHALKQAAQDCDQNLVSISLVKTTDGTSNQNLNELDYTFMYTQILKEILITIDFEQEHINEFLTYCREQLTDNTIELQNVEKLREEYCRHQPIWWYTFDCFLYSMLNRALRKMEVDLIIKMGFFVRDLHQHIVALHSEQYGGQNHSSSFTVFRGQGLTQTDFDQLMKAQGGLLSFNNFLSTSKDRNMALDFARRTMLDPNLVGVLFVMEIDPSISTTPFANVRDASFYHAEEEILFSMHCVFRIGQIKQIDKNDRFWQVKLALTSDNDPQFQALTQRMREETEGTTGWFRLGKLMIKLGHFNKAEELHNILLKQANDERKEGDILYQLGCIKDNQGEYTEAMIFYERSLKIRQKLLTSNHPDVAECYNDIGGVHFEKGELSKALSYYEKAIEIYQKTLSPNHLDFATSYNNVGLVYENMGEYAKALSYYEKALKIRQETLPPNHLYLATSYNNIGLVYVNTGEYSKALSYYEKAFEIRQKTLPENHRDLANSYNNIGGVYENMGEPSKALLNYEKDLKICEKILSPNHPDLATSYSNIGGVYSKMGKYSEALSFCEKAVEIYQKTLPPDHPHMATSYNNIGLVYVNMGEYSKALSYYEKTIEIYQKTLSPNHPYLATSYNNIGEMYEKMDEYSKALSYYERAADIAQRSLSDKHSNLQMIRQSIERVKKKL